MDDLITVKLDIPHRYIRSVQMACSRRNYQVNTDWDTLADNGKEWRVTMTIAMPEREFADMLAGYSRKDFTDDEVV